MSRYSSIPFCSIQFYVIQFYSILVCSIAFPSVLFYSILFRLTYFILLFSFHLYSTLFYSILFYSILFYSIQTGECSIGCKGDMFYGPTCKEPCNGNCATVSRESGGQCERTGYCRFDCVKGTYGDKCENTCPAAAACTDGTCHRKNGNCSECDAIDPGPLCPSAGNVWFILLIL